MFNFLLALQAVVAAAMIGVILVQRSEGGGLGVGGNPAGLLSARGAANLLTRATAILAICFVALSITLAAIASMQNRGVSIDTSLSKTARDSSSGAAGADISDSVAPPLFDDNIHGGRGESSDVVRGSDSAINPAPSASESPPLSEDNRR